MLVKLGSVWVDPTRVVFMEPGIFSDAKENNHIVTTDGSCRSVGSIDDFASIVNNAGQSFGGEEDEKPKDA